jgi:Domain of unknown function (DUF4406)
VSPHNIHTAAKRAEELNLSLLSEGLTVQHLDPFSLVWFSYDANKFPQGRGYVAGPMTGYDKFNYAAFDAARNTLAHEGWHVINPADLDRINLGVNFGEMTGQEDLRHFSTSFARQDIASLLVVDAVFLLPGWEKSTGANNEARIGKMLGVEIFSYETREPIQIEARFASAGSQEK